MSVQNVCVELVGAMPSAGLSELLGSGAPSLDLWAQLFS